MSAKYGHADRAKQFAPFDALTGLMAAIRKKEEIVVEKPDMAEDRLEELDRIVHSLQPGEMVTVIYYNVNRYLKISGLVSRIDFENKRLYVVKTCVEMDAIVDIIKETMI